jgi:tripartite-type tricarboxylate transporter receptor subunit TctC
MKLPRRRFLHLAVGAASLPALSDIARAQAYPTRPITVIVPFPAGGPLDTVARILSDRMKATLGQPIVVENLAGANGTIGVGTVRASTDGYTIVAGTVTTHVLIGALYALQSDLLKDFKPIALLGQGPLLVVAKKTMPANDLNGLLAWLRANPNKATQGTAGIAAIEHIAGILLQKQTGTQFLQVTYRGLAPARVSSLLAPRGLELTLAAYVKLAARAKPEVGSGQVRRFGPCPPTVRFALH